MDISVYTDRETFSEEEADFINQHAEDLCEAIRNISNRSEKDALEFGETFVPVQLMEVMQASRELCIEWITDEFGLEIGSKFEDYKNLIIDDNSSEELSAAAFVYDYTQELFSMLLDEYFIPAIALNQLHKTWEKRHSKR